jgi:polyphenol oxidase
MRVVARFDDKRVGGVLASDDDATVTKLEQVHGAAVVRVDRIGSQCGSRADAAVTDVAGARLRVQCADCAPVLLTAWRAARPVALGVAHGGWRGLLAGVVPATVAALSAYEPDYVSASLYPCIGARCYEFGADDLATVAAALGPEVRSSSAAGTSSLDMVAAVRASLRHAGVDELDLSPWSCTACDAERFYSFRARRETGRLALVAWLEETDG